MQEDPSSESRWVPVQDPAAPVQRNKVMLQQLLSEVWLLPLFSLLVAQVMERQCYYQKLHSVSAVAGGRCVRLCLVILKTYKYSSFHNTPDEIDVVGAAEHLHGSDETCNSNKWVQIYAFTRDGNCNGWVSDNMWTEEDNMQLEG